MVRLAACLAASLLASPEANAADRLLIQVWYENPPTLIDASDDPGRIEVEVKGKFVGCLKASTFRQSADRIYLIPVAVGYSAAGRAEDVKVNVMGQLRQWGTPKIKITKTADAS